MKLAPSSVGAEPKKLVLLGAILAVGAVLYWLQNRGDASVSANVSPAPVAATPAPVAPPPPNPSGERELTGQQTESPVRGGLQNASIERRGPLGSSGSDSWVPSMKKDDNLDVSKVDPRIRLDLLAKVREVPLEGGASSLFDYSKPPEPPTPKVDAIIPKTLTVPPPAAITKAPPAAPKQVTPPPAPIPFKYYGYAGTPTAGPLQGLFVEGDPINGTIYAKSEGDMIKDRYKVLRIGIRSADVEDTKDHHQQTLKMPEDQQ
jgi:hypothetical protein